MHFGRFFRSVFSFCTGGCYELLLQTPLHLDVLRDIPARLFILLHNLSQGLLYEFV